MSTLHCPTCGRVFKPEDSQAKPFCSNRCRQIDLGRWLDEKQTLPNMPNIDDDDLPQGDDPSD